MFSGMIPCMRRWLLLLWLVPVAAEQWQVRCFYDERNSTLTITDFYFPFARRGIAVGIIDNGKKPRPVSVISTDAGAHWQVRPLSEPPLSLFFVNEDLGWMVTSPHPWENRIWRTTDGGLTWRGLPTIQPQVMRVYFADANHGWAIGSRQTVLQTLDGGQTWNAAAGVQANPSRKYDTAYEWITFANRQVGLIVGWERLPDAVMPAWMDPESSLPSKKSHFSYELNTADGGATWK